MKRKVGSHDIPPIRETDRTRSTPVVDADPSTAADRDRTVEPTRRGADGGRPMNGRRFSAGDLLADRYRIVHLLGRGGMGEVYLADDLTLKQPVALKLLPAGLERDARLLSRLTEEVALARQVTHRSVCRVYDIGESGDHHFLSMEYIDGENLASLLRRVGRLSGDRAIEVAVEICNGLQAAHAEGILHRDLKPSNLMLDGRGRVKVTDFGLAGLSSTAPQGPRMGTPSYMAPEVFAGEPTTVRSDLYALGLVLYQIFTGQRAFASASARRSPESPPRPSSLVEGLPSAVDEVVLACLAYAPRERPASASAIAEALTLVGAGSDTLLKTLIHTVVGELPAVCRSDYDALVLDLIRDHEAQRLDAEPDLRIALERPQDGVRFALAYHRGLSELATTHDVMLDAGVAIHLGELSPSSGELSGHHAPRVDDDSDEIVSGLARLAAPRQTLLTRSAFDLARQAAETERRDLGWRAHGAYELEGLGEPLRVFEVGVEGFAPLVAPDDKPGFRRRLLQPVVAGWRPAVGLELPQRPHWVMDRRLGEGGFGEVWLAVHRKTDEHRVFKFCYDEARLRALQREITLFRVLKENLGERDDITRIFDWNFDQSPFFIEAAYTAGGSLVDWTESMGGASKVPLETRLDIVAQVATALAAAHSVGVLHKDVKPGNVLITLLDDGSVRAQLNDFGVGRLTEQERLIDAGITALGMTELPGTEGTPPTDGGTRLYTAPELIEGKPASLQADIYALGVVLYQMVIGDLSRALAPGWERLIDDDLLRDDIAAAVDGSPEERLVDARRLADRLGRLDERRRHAQARRREEAEARQAKDALAAARRRRRMAFAAVGGMIAAILVAIALSIQSRHIARQAEESELILGFLVDLFEQTDPYRRDPEPLTARAMLDRGAEKIGDSLADHPEARARLTHLMGVVYGNLGYYDTSRALLTDALDLRRESHGDGPHPHVVESMNALAESLNQNNRYQAAGEMARDTLERLEAVGEDDGLPAAESMTVIAESLFSVGDYSGAESFARRALDIQQTKLGEHHADVAQGLQLVALCLTAQDRYGPSEALYRRSLAIFRTIYGDEHPKVAFARYHLGILMTKQGDPVAAEGFFDESLASFRKTLGEAHPFVAASLSKLASAVYLQGRYEEAITLYASALASNEQAGPANQDTAEILNSMAETYLTMEAFEKAREQLDTALDIYRAELGDRHYLIAECQQSLALAHAELGRFGVAETLYRESHAMLVELQGPDALGAHEAMVGLGEVLLMADAAARAEPILRRSLDGLRRHLGAEPRDDGAWPLSWAESALGGALAELGELAEAELLLTGSLRHQASGADTPARLCNLRSTLERLEALHARRGDAEQADDLRRQLASLSLQKDPNRRPRP